MCIVPSYYFEKELNLYIKLIVMNAQILSLFIIKNVVPLVLLAIVFFKVILPILTIIAHILRLLLTLVRDLVALIVGFVQKKRNSLCGGENNRTRESQAKFFGYK